MKRVLRNAFAFVAGIAAMAVVKFAVTAIGNALIPLPAGVDLSTVEGYKAAMEAFEIRHWATPFLEHAAGSFAGGFTVSLLAANHHRKLAIALGALHISGAIAAVFLLPVPIWFVAIDLIIAYFPMVLLGARIGHSR